MAVNEPSLRMIAHCKKLNHKYNVKDGYISCMKELRNLSWYILFSNSTLVLYILPRATIVFKF